MTSERKFIKESVKRVLLKEYLKRKTERSGFGGLDIQRTPMGTRVTLIAERPGMVIGRKGESIKELTEYVQNEFKFDNPQIEVKEVPNPNLNPHIMAQKLATALERGWHFRRAGHSTVRRIMSAGAKGCQVIISGKLTGQRHRTEKFREGHIKYCGETKLIWMREGFAVAKKKLGVIGVKVQIMDPNAKLPDEIELLELEEVVDIKSIPEDATIDEGLAAEATVEPESIGEVEGEIDPESPLVTDTTEPEIPQPEAIKPEAATTKSRKTKKELEEHEKEKVEDKKVETKEKDKEEEPKKARATKKSQKKAGTEKKSEKKDKDKKDESAEEKVTEEVDAAEPAPASAEPTIDITETVEEIEPEVSDGLVESTMDTKAVESKKEIIEETVETEITPEKSVDETNQGQDAKTEEALESSEINKEEVQSDQILQEDEQVSGESKSADASVGTEKVDENKEDKNKSKEIKEDDEESKAVETDQEKDS